MLPFFSGIFKVKNMMLSNIMLVFKDPFIQDIEVTLPFKKCRCFFLPQKLGFCVFVFFFRYQAMADKIHNKIKTIKLATSTGPANSSGFPPPREGRCLSLPNVPRFEDVEAEQMFFRPICGIAVDTTC